MSLPTDGVPEAVEAAGGCHVLRIPGGPFLVKGCIVFPAGESIATLDLYCASLDAGIALLGGALAELRKQISGLVIAR